MAKVLIVEDDLMLALDLRHEVMRLGYEVTGMAKSSNEAYAAAVESRPDMALMDINIFGEMDGIETAHMLQVAFGFPVIFLTSANDGHSVSRAVNERPYAYLVKPVKRLELKASMAAALRNSLPKDSEESIHSRGAASVGPLSEEAPPASPVHELLFMPATPKQLAERGRMVDKMKHLYELLTVPDKQ